MGIKQSICYPILGKLGFDLADLFRIGAEIGYAAIEMWNRSDDFKDTIALAKEHNLVVASMCGHNSLHDGLNNPANHDRIESELIHSIDIAASHGIPGIICFSGNRLECQSEEDAIEATANGLHRVAHYAEKQNVNLNLELLNSKIDHPGYQCDHTSWGVSVCKRVNSPNVKLLYDIYHMQIMEGDVIRTVTKNIHWIGHFHTAGVPGRNNLDNTQELNYTAICNAIAATGYRYYIGHEFIPNGDPIESLRTAFQICNTGYR